MHLTLLSPPQGWTGAERRLLARCSRTTPSHWAWSDLRAGFLPADYLPSSGV